MSNLQVTYQEDNVTLDEFYKSMMFQRIMDGDFSRDERDVMLVIFRKTLHFDKWHDRLGIFWLSESVGVCQSKLRKTIKQLEAKGLIDVERSKGGRTDSHKKYSKFSIGGNFISMVVREWVQIKDENDFSIGSEY